MQPHASHAGGADDRVGPPAAPARVPRSQYDRDDLFRLLVESVPDHSIFLIGVDGCIATWNEGARRIKGYEAAEIVGEPYERFFTPEDRVAAKPARLLAEAAKFGSIHDEGWRLRQDGSRFWASATLTALYDRESGNLRGYAKVTHDETAAHEAAEALRRSEERFRLAVGALRGQAFYVLSPAGLVESWNPGAQLIKGYASAEIIGRHFSLFFTPEDRAAGKPQQELATAASAGSFAEEGWRVRKDGTRFWASVTVTAMHDETGALRGFAKATRDESERHAVGLALREALERAREAEARLRGHAAGLERRVEERTIQLAQQADALRRSNAELEQFAYIASHDLKEPLRMITSYLGILRHRYDHVFDAKANEYMDRVESSTRRMHELIQSVLEYSNAEEHAQSVEAVPMRLVVDLALDNLRQSIAESGATILVGDLPTVQAHRVHLIRVFQNLIGNALKFRAERPLEVRVSAVAGDDEWTFSVADNGIGIDPAYHGKLFRIFQRLHARDEYAGSGIGLASCKKIIERHDGRIWVESALGAGTTFHFTLPR